MKGIIDEYGGAILYFIISCAVISVFYHVVFGDQMKKIISMNDTAVSDNQYLIDADKPVITASDITIYQDTSINPEDFVRVDDTVDGNITNQVTYRSNVNVHRTGNYTIRYRVVNSFGLTTEKAINVLVIER